MQDSRYGRSVATAQFLETTLLPREFAARTFFGAAWGATADTTAQRAGCENHPPAQQGQEQLGAQVGVGGHQDEDGEGTGTNAGRRLRGRVPKSSHQSVAARILEHLGLPLEVERQVAYWFEPLGGIPIYLWERTRAACSTASPAQNDDNLAKVSSFRAATPASYGPFLPRSHLRLLT